jgi:hypothetical protein
VEIPAVEPHDGPVSKVKQADELLARLRILLGHAMPLHEDALSISAVLLLVLVDLHRVVHEVVENSELTHAEGLREVLWNLGVTVRGCQG